MHYSTCFNSCLFCYVCSCIALYTRLAVDDLKVYKVGSFNDERFILVEFDRSFVILSKIFYSFFDHVKVDWNLIICLAVHEVVELTVIVQVLHLLCLDVSIIEFVIRVECFFTDSACYDVLVLSSYKSSALARLYMLKVEYYVRLSVYLECYTFSEISCC